jgi:hypothetical protein
MPTTFGIDTSGSPEETTSVTRVRSLAWAFGEGSCDATAPRGTPATGLEMTLPTEKPASVSVCWAVICVCPMTEGTG